MACLTPFSDDLHVTTGSGCPHNEKVNSEFNITDVVLPSQKSGPPKIEQASIE